MVMASWGWLVGLFGFLVWLAVIVYVLVLATRLVTAVEKIAGKLGE